MAAFSYQHQYHPFLLDSVFLSSNDTNMVVEEGNFMNTNLFSQFSPPKLPLVQEINSNCHISFNPLEYGGGFENGCVDHSSSKIAAVTDNELSSVTKNQSILSSTVVDNCNKIAESGEQVTQSTVTQMDKKRKNRNNSSSSNSAESKDLREVKSKRQKKCNDGEKAEEEKNNPKAEKKNQKKVPEEPPKDYIHVRARRGQATDSHSLAERVRREKISERMKTLQKLVPGCDKVTGKALMLDEIINYVQSLQNQVEFLSMKLASVNPMFYEFGMDLDAFVDRPDQGLNVASAVPAMQSVPQCSPTQLTAFADTTTATATAGFGPADNCYPILDTTAASLLLQQGQRPINDFSHQDNGSLLWDVEEQKQKFLNPSGFTNNLCSFH